MTENLNRLVAYILVKQRLATPQETPEEIKQTYKMNIEEVGYALASYLFSEVDFEEVRKEMIKEMGKL
ncbi:MAG: hypothetical protein QW318_06340 [Candidatus Caldarchaeum sp.]